MVHLLVHIVPEIIDLGPAFLHTMFPFERMNGRVKGYVRNKACPDGSIMQSYLTEECISFCKNYIEDDESIGLPVSKHTNRLEGVGHSQLKRDLNVDAQNRRDDFNRAHTVVLVHAEMITPWLQNHKETLRKQRKTTERHRTEGQISREHNAKFASWFKERFQNNLLPSGVDNANLIYALLVGPICTVATYQAYDINGYTFYTEAKDKDSDYQNSGVSMLSITENESKRYYGRIEEIWELEYGESYTVPLFRVRWAKSVQKEERGFITMSLPEARQGGPKSVKGVTAQYEPWVFAKDVSQCFYLTNPANPSRVIVRRGKRNIIGMDGVACEEDFDQFGVDPTEEDGYDDEEHYIPRRSRTTLPRTGRPFLRKSHSTGRNYSKKIKKTETIIERNVKQRRT